MSCEQTDTTPTWRTLKISCDPAAKQTTHFDNRKIKFWFSSFEHALPESKYGVSTRWSYQTRWPLFVFSRINMQAFAFSESNMWKILYTMCNSCGSRFQRFGFRNCEIDISNHDFWNTTMQTIKNSIWKCRNLLWHVMRSASGDALSLTRAN